MFSASSTSILVLVGGAATLLYIFYRWALPRPIPGIPYNKDSAQSILGDIPGLVEADIKTRQIFPWMTAQIIKLNSPIIQLFCRPLGKPWVVLADFRESQDILLRRTREFDRSDHFAEVFHGLIPDMHIHMKSHEERFKQNRNLMNPLMTPTFLNELKMKLASGRPFRADRDVYYAALDFIFAATFGLNYKTNAMETQKRFLLSTPDIKIPDSVNEVVEFPVTDRPPVIDAIVTLSESVEVPMKSSIPRLHHALLRQLPYMRKAREEKEDLITAEIEQRISRLESGDMINRTALDDILQRELKAAKKEGRTPNLKSRAIYDELLGFLMAGYDTTSATIAWAVKHLAWTPRAQSALRTSLRNAYGDAARERRNPTVREITHISVPYLDATIEEIHRVALVFPGTVRDAVTDTMVLGHRIPKGTRVFLMQTGPGFFSEAFDIPDQIRSKSAIEAKYQIGLWDPLSTGEFKPERWLTKDEQGNEVYNSMAGPHLAFGLGPRGCYGRRLAYLELRISLALLVWNFEFLPCPDELSSWDAIQKISRIPKACYIRLKKAEW